MNIGSKTKLIVLILLFFIVWTIVAFRIYYHLQSDLELNPIFAQRVRPKETRVNRDFTLNLSYSDPFLRSFTIKGAITKNSAIPKSISTPKVKPPPSKLNSSFIDWSKIEYVGAIYNASKSEILATVRINSIDYFVKQSAKVEGFLVNKVTLDSIELAFNEQTKFIKRNR